MTTRETLKIKKAKLARETSEYKNLLSDKVKDTISHLERGLITVVIVGGSTFLAYKFFKSFLEPDEKTKETSTDESGPENQLDLKFSETTESSSQENELDAESSSKSDLWKGAGEVIMLMLLSFAKTKLMEYLENLGKKEDGKN